MEFAQSDAAAYMDWYRIETERAYLRPEDEVTGNPADNYERRPAGLAGMWEGVRYQMYEASDGHVLFMASEQAFWKNFCQGVDRMDLFEAYPGAKYADHAKGNVELQRELQAVFKTKTCQEWLAFSEEWVTTIAPVNTTKNIGTIRTSRLGWTSTRPTPSDASSYRSPPTSTANSRRVRPWRPRSARTPTR